MPRQDAPLQSAAGFSQLYEHSYLAIFRFIYALHGGPAEEVEDLTAETFMRAWKARARFRGDQPAAQSWLVRIARNLVIDQHRRKKVRGPAPNLEDLDAYLLPDSQDASPEHVASQQEDFRTLWRLIQGLPARQREMLVLRYVLGWQVKRIAAHLEMNENTVSVNLRRILERLRRDWPQEKVTNGRDP